MSQKSYVNAYLDLPELEKDIFGNKIIDGQYKVNEKGEMTSVYKNEIKQYHFEDIDVLLFGEDEVKTVDFHIVFDVDDVLTTELNKIREEYKTIYPDDSESKITYSSYIYYISKPEEVTNEWKQNKLKQLHETEEAELQKQMENISNYDLFGIEVSGDDYLLIFLKTSIVSQIPYYDETSKQTTYPALSAAYKYTGFFNKAKIMNFEFEKVTNISEFGKKLGNEVFEALGKTDQAEYLLQVLGYVLIFPAIFVLLLCWSMKKRGVMKTYKEYYNVASIASILPMLITFILAWFIPKVAPIYGALFCVFVLFAFIRINSTPELAD